MELKCFITNFGRRRSHKMGNIDILQNKPEEDSGNYRREKHVRVADCDKGALPKFH